MKRFALAICLFAFIAVPGCTPDVQPTPSDIQLDDGPCCPGPCEDLAGRYHHRKHTKRFFGRVA